MKKLCSLALMICLIYIFPVRVSAAGVFSDVAEDSWYHQYVVEMSQRGVLAGYPDGTFRPEANVTCAEALKMILGTAGAWFSAEEGSHWAAGYRDLALRNGFLNEEETAGMDLPVTRATVAKLTARVLGLNIETADSPYADNDDPEVVALYDAGIMNGIMIGDALCFAGERSFKRSELCAVIWRMQRYQLSLSGLLPEQQLPGAGPPDQTEAVLPDIPDEYIPPLPGYDQELQPAPELPDTSQPPIRVPGGTIVYNHETYAVLEDVPVFSFEPQSFYLQDGRMHYRGDSVRLVHGIDVSAHQGEIDWQQVQEDGVEFAILRAAYRGYTVGSLNVDACFENNIRGALNAGLDVGVYVFSQAISEEEALEEADLLIQLLEPHDIDGPVVFDWEVIGQKHARTYGLDTETLCKAANAFCRRIKEAGYRPMIYFNSYCGYAKYDLSEIMEYDFWFAQYREQPDFYYDYQMWQYSDKGKIAGIEGNVDLNVLLLK